MKKLHITQSQVDLLIVALAIFFAHAAYYCTQIIWLKEHINILTNVSIILFFPAIIFKIIKNKYSFKQVVFTAILLAIGIASKIIAGDAAILFIVMLSIVYQSSKLDAVVKIDLISKIIVSIFIVSNFAIGQTITVERYRNEDIREAFGFRHPNALGFMAMTIFADYLYLNRNKKQKIKNLLVLLILLGFVIAADSRTSILLLIVIFIVSILPKKEQRAKKKKILKLLISLLPLWLFILSIIFTMLYKQGNQFVITVNQMLSNRIRLQAYYEIYFNITLLGENIDFHQAALDNAYYRVLYHYGIVGITTVLGYCSYAIYKSREEDIVANRFLLVFLLYSLSEWLPFKFLVTPYWLIAVTDNEEKSSDKELRIEKNKKNLQELKK